MTRDYLHISETPIKPQSYPFVHLSNSQLEELSDAVTREERRRSDGERRRLRFLADLRRSEKQEARDRASLPYLVGHTGLLAIPPGCMMNTVQYRLYLLHVLLQQDWSHLFKGGDERAKYYVYAHVDPNASTVKLPDRCGGRIYMPFYIGKGTGNRAYNLQRNQGHGLKLKQLADSGASAQQVVRLLRTDLSEGAAFELEAKLVYFFGTIYDKAANGVLLNLDPCLRPRFAGFMRSKSSLSANKPPNSIPPEIER